MARRRRIARTGDWRSLGRYPDTIRIRSRFGLRPMLIVLLAIGMTTGCAWLTFASNHGASYRSRITPFDRLVGVIGMLFFGAATLATLVNTLRTGAGVTLTPEGLTDRTTAVSMGLVRWDEMSGVVPATTFGVGFVGIPVRNPQEVLARSGDFLLAAKTANLNHGNLNTPVWINTEVLPIDPTSLAALINDYHEAWRLDHPAAPGPHSDAS